MGLVKGRYGIDVLSEDSSKESDDATEGLDTTGVELTDYESDVTGVLIGDW